MKRISFVFILLVTFFTNINSQIVDASGGIDGGFGFVDSKDQWVGRHDYENTYWDKDEKYGIFKYNGKWGAVDSKGKVIVPCEYDEVAYCTEPNYLEVRQIVNGKKLTGLHDKANHLIIPCKYINISCYKYGITVVDASGKVGVFNYSGKEILEVKYSNFIVMDDESNVNILNLGGTNTLDLWGTPKNVSGGKWGVSDNKGNIIVPFEYDGCSEVADNLFAVNRGGVTIYKDGLWSSYVKGGKWGLFAYGKEIIPCKYDEAPEFVNDVAMVKENGVMSTLKNPLKDASQIYIAQSENTYTNKKTIGGPAVSRYPAPDSDVDRDIPVAKNKAENTFAFIIANENYPDAPVPYSLNDGRMFKEYCQKALGLPEKNINLYEDATFGNIITAVEKMKQVADAYDGEASVILYYAGHGFPDDKQQTAYLLPIDGDASSITTTGYSLAKLYKEIAGLKLKSAIVFLDACFSGAKREDQMLASSRGVAIKVKEEAPQGNMLVYSAAQGDETAHQLEDKHHGLFTYYLLKQLQATGGNVDMGTLTEYVTKQVKRQSVVINNKKQTPTVIPSQALMNSWQTMKLR